MTRRTLALSLLVLTSFAALEGCRRKVEPAPAPSTAADAAQRRADSLASEAARRRADSVAAANAAASRDAAAANDRQAALELSALLTQRVYFDYDRDQLREDGASVLDAKAAVLLANPSITLAITGHTDERGTAEYNLALGQRRAAAVKRYLASKGVGDGRLTTQSLGDSQPVAAGSDEGAYQQNRRAEFEVRGMTGALVRPRE
ncbi:MAG TPA: OmpA family protein [Gemmatimonadaceae bacterium]|nr:OmpA family protein [Gemmatimonadaceae bacterium]